MENMNLFLAVGDAVWQSAIAGLVTLFLAWMARKMNTIEKVADKTHALVNSTMGYQLKMHATVTRRLAAITGDAADKEAADQAAQLLKDHDEKQAVVDANLKTP